MTKYGYLVLILVLLGGMSGLLACGVDDNSTFKSVSTTTTSAPAAAETKIDRVIGLKLEITDGAVDHFSLLVLVQDDPAKPQESRPLRVRGPAYGIRFVTDLATGTLPYLIVISPDYNCTTGYCFSKSIVVHLHSLDELH